MKCDKCGKEFPENEIDESHFVPCYMFDGIDRKEKKNQADKTGRCWLCKDCHKIYELLVIAHVIKIIPEEVKIQMRLKAQSFGKWWLKNGFLY
jgi:Zn-finger protein